MPTLIEETKFAVLVKYEFEIRQKKIQNVFFWSVPTIRKLIQEKNKDSIVAHSFTSAVFWIEILMEEIEQVVAEKQLFEIRE